MFKNRKKTAAGLMLVMALGAGSYWSQNEKSAQPGSGLAYPSEISRVPKVPSGDGSDGSSNGWPKDARVKSQLVMGEVGAMKGLGSDYEWPIGEKPRMAPPSASSWAATAQMSQFAMEIEQAKTQGRVAVDEKAVSKPSPKASQKAPSKTMAQLAWMGDPEVKKFLTMNNEQRARLSSMEFGRLLRKSQEVGSFAGLQSDESTTRKDKEPSRSAAAAKDVAAVDAWAMGDDPKRRKSNPLDKGYFNSNRSQLDERNSSERMSLDEFISMTNAQRSTLSPLVLGAMIKRVEGVGAMENPSGDQGSSTVGLISVEEFLAMDTATRRKVPAQEHQRLNRMIEAKEKFVSSISQSNQEVVKAIKAANARAKPHKDHEENIAEALAEDGLANSERSALGAKALAMTPTERRQAWLDLKSMRDSGSAATIQGSAPSMAQSGRAKGEIAPVQNQSDVSKDKQVVVHSISPSASAFAWVMAGLSALGLCFLFMVKRAKRQKDEREFDELMHVASEGLRKNGPSSGGVI